MNAEQRLAAVTDLLKYQRDSRRDIDRGRALSRLLLSGDWGGEADDLRLLDALTAAVQAELGAWRLRAGIPVVANNPDEERELLRQGLGDHYQELGWYSLLWGHYFEDYSTSELGNLAGVTKRTIEQRLSEARRYLAQQLQRREAETIPAGPVAAQPQLPTIVPALPTPQPALQPQPQPRQQHTTINGDHAQVITGDVHGPVVFNQPVAPPPKKSADDGSESIVGILALGLLVGGYQLLTSIRS